MSNDNILQPYAVYFRCRLSLAAATLASFSACAGESFRTTGAAVFFGLAATGSALVAATTGEAPATSATGVAVSAAAVKAGAASLMISDCSSDASLGFGADFTPPALER